MGLVRTHIAILEPLLNRAILIPSVVSGQSLLGRHARVLKDLIFLLKNGDGLNGLLIRVF